MHPTRLVSSSPLALVISCAAALWGGCGPATETAPATHHASGGTGASAGVSGEPASTGGGSSSVGMVGAAGGEVALGGGGAGGSGGSPNGGSAGSASGGGAAAGSGGSLASGGTNAVGGSATAGAGGAAASAGAAGAPNGCNLPATVSFKNDVQKFLIPSCSGAGCHVIDNSSTMSMGGYNHAYDWITATSHASSCPSGAPKRFEVVIAVINAANPPSCSKSRKMPPDPATHAPLTPCQIATLQAWLDEPLVTQTHRVDDTSPTTPYPMPPFN